MFSNDKYYVTDHNYFNTGGNCMVSIFTVYDRTINETRFVVANDEGFNYQTADTISCAEEFDFEELEAIILETHNWEALTTEPAPWQHNFADEDWELFKYCQFEFYKKDCQYFKTKVKLPVEWLLPELYTKLAPAAIEWLHANEQDIETDGEHVFMPDAYVSWQSEQLDKQLEALKDYKKWLDDLVCDALDAEDIEKYYNCNFKLTFNGREVELPFEARTYQAVSDLLKDVIEDW